MRVRFAPSPTGPLHIGGVRTALYNYLLAKKHGGSFILRIEDTDQKRYVSGAESYIIQALQWLGLEPDEGPEQGGAFGPYRQSERSALYREEIKKLVDKGVAYLAFDTPQDLEQMRERQSQKGIHSPKYDHTIRMEMRNSLTMSAEEVKGALNQGIAHVVRLKVEPGQKIQFDDAVRGKVVFDSTELDDKVLLKSDGLPTYHLANVVDDQHMKISHVIRGEEWLSSTAHHVLLYRAFGWQSSMPVFAHLPLILKPVGKGKLSKRDGTKLGIPVFPLSWNNSKDQEALVGFKEYGFLAPALINFLAMLGWNPGTEQELFSLDQLIDQFEIKQISKSGARFDFEKAKWYNQQYIAGLMDSELARLIAQPLKEAGFQPSQKQLFDLADLMKDRLETINQIVPKTAFLFETPQSYDEKQLKKRWNKESAAQFSTLIDQIKQLDFADSTLLEAQIKKYVQQAGYSLGRILPLIRLALCGSLQGPDLFRIMQFLGKENTLLRLNRAKAHFSRYLD